MKRISHLLILSLIITGYTSFQLCGQEGGLSQESLFSQVKTLKLRNSERSYNDISGSPYYTDSFTESTIHLNDGNYSKIPLRFDLFQGEMEFIKDRQKLWLKKKDVKFIEYGTDTIFLYSVKGDTSKPEYYFLKDDGKIKLFYKKVIIYFPYVEAKGYSNPIPDRFLPDKNLIYIMKEKIPPVKIVTKRDLTAAFSDDENALKFIKTHRIKPDDIEGLHLLVRYVNKR